MSKHFSSAAAMAALLALAACTGVKPEKVIATVKPGLTQTELMTRIGPPDSQYDDNGHACFQYAIGEDNNVPLAVYFDDQQRVARTERANCRGRLR
ncbi:hypothetical protein [Paraburkholderia sp.]|uniref:hypothetical protein n=1 Tax=Paraburkholderia sp. TaxID=1926495 RepID=UPI0025EC38A3|nr:hypothetical protein [Paraburkholderia sp.]